MKRIISTSLCLLIFMTFGASQGHAAGEWTGNINVLLGAKTMDDDDWEPMEDHGEFGIILDFKQKGGSLYIEVALLGSAAEEEIDELVYFNGAYRTMHIELEGTTSEWRLGAKKIWEPNQVMRPFIAGGLSAVGAEMEAQSGGIIISDDDYSLGLWVSGGVFWTLNNSFNLGIELGFSKAKVSLFQGNTDAGGSHFGLLLGYHW